MNISETSCPIKVKFHLEHHWGEGLPALGFRQDCFRTQVSMATGLMGKIFDHTSSFIYDWFFYFLAGNEDNHKISNGSKFGRIGPGNYELAVIECPEKSP